MARHSIITGIILIQLLSVGTAGARPAALPATTPHGILADRVAPLAGIDELDGRQAAIAALPRWRQAVHELRRAAEGDLGWNPPRAIQTEARREAAPGVVPLGLVHARYDRLDDSGRTVPGEVFTFAPLRDRVYDGARLDFRLDPQRILTHATTPLVDLRFDAGDGRGFRELPAGETVTVRYGRSGPKDLVLKANLVDGRTLIARSVLDVARLVTPAPDDTLAITATEAHLGTFGTGSAYVYLAPGRSALAAPAIVVEGFDLDDTMDWPVLYDLLNQENLIEDLRADGFDAVVLDFTEATAPIQRNAFVLAELLTQVEATIGPDRTTAVIGASMGGLVSRYALAWLEQNGGHNVRTWISFDTPHTGANIPLGLQHWLDFFQGESADAAFLLSRLDTPAARQMLLYHHRSTVGTTAAADPRFVAFRADLAAVGDWPTLPRRVAVANGSGVMQSQGFGPGAQIVLYEYRSFLADLDGNVWAVPDGGSNVIFDGMIDLIWPLPDTDRTVTVAGTLPWDGAPGGHRGSMAQMDATEASYGDIIALHDNHCFIPTVSALALGGAGPFFDIAGAPDLMALTAFDQLYWPAENQGHIAITAENKPWFMDEIRAGVSATPDTPILAGTVLHPAAPNPFNPRTVIRFELGGRDEADLRIYDLAGRLVRTLIDRSPLEAGTHRWAWNGRDDNGRVAAAGVYLVRLETSGRVDSQRLTLVK